MKQGEAQKRLLLHDIEPRQGIYMKVSTLDTMCDA